MRDMDEEKTEDLAGEVEERARIDEVTHNDDTRVLEAIAALADKLDGIRDMVSAFVEVGGVVSENLDEASDDDVLTIEQAIAYDDVVEEIDEEVIRDLSKVEFD